MSTDRTPRVTTIPRPERLLRPVRPPEPRRFDPTEDAGDRWFNHWDAATVDVEELAALAYRQAGEIAQLVAYLRLAHAARDRAAAWGACAVVATLTLAVVLAVRMIGGL